eukprot:PLAT5359.3.p2 GENE.PLAT5359.3~~PLAT5359.3.p2  ORF type:complete len:174 (+),score=90.27 PLAT5359.3:206-727(+)
MAVPSAKEVHEEDDTAAEEHHAPATPPPHASSTTHDDAEEEDGDYKRAADAAGDGEEEKTEEQALPGDDFTGDQEQQQQQQQYGMQADGHPQQQPQADDTHDNDGADKKTADAPRGTPAGGAADTTTDVVDASKLALKDIFDDSASKDLPAAGAAGPSDDSNEHDPTELSVVP